LLGTGERGEARVLGIVDEEDVACADLQVHGQARIMGLAVERSARDLDRQLARRSPAQRVLHGKTVAGHDQSAGSSPRGRPIRDCGNHGVAGIPDDLVGG
jgi:hypothetical protein